MADFKYKIDPKIDWKKWGVGARDWRNAATATTTTPWLPGGGPMPTGNGLSAYSGVPPAFAAWYLETYGRPVPEGVTLANFPPYDYWVTNIQGGGTGGGEGGAGTTPTVSGRPVDAELIAPGLYISKSTGKYYDEYGDVVSQGYASQILNDYLNPKPTEGQMATERERIRQETMRLQNLYNRRPEAIDSRESDFEDYRQKMLGVLTGPQDWIERWSLQNAPNPYAKKELDERQQIKADIKRVKESKAYWARIATDASPEAQEVAQFGMETADKNLKMFEKLNEKYVQGKELADRIRAEISETGVPQSLPGGQGGMPVHLQKQLAAEQAYKAALKTPDWLAPYTSGQIAGEPMGKENIPTPSAQMFRRLSPSKLQGLAGYTEWSGGETLEDKIDRMTQMLPKNPSRGFSRRAMQY